MAENIEIKAMSSEEAKQPGGLQLYWLMSSLTAVIQQYFIMKRGE